MTGLLILFISHFIADFLLQSRDMAVNKSKNMGVLINHCSIQFFVILVLMVLFSPLDMVKASQLAFINAAFHGLIDWNIWKGFAWFTNQRLLKFAKRCWGDIEEIKQDYRFYEDHWFYVTIGLDQLLHGLTLIVLWRLFI